MLFPVTPRQVAQNTSRSGKGAVRPLGQHFPWSRMSLHTLPAQRCPIPGDLGGCSCNRNNAPHRLGGFQPSLSHIALMQSDKYIPLYPAPLTLRLISKPDSAQLLGSQCHMQHHLPGTAARLGTWQRCRTQPSSTLIPPCAPGSNTPGDFVTAKHQEQPQPSDTRQHKASSAEETGAVGHCY